jgi:RND family efflux transporter MFP subunit
VNSSTYQKLWGTILVIATISTGCSRSNPEAQASSSPPIPVQLATLTATTLEESSEFVGNLEATEKVVVKPEIEGRIKEIRVNPGDRVNQGDVMMVLEPDRTQPELENAEAGVKVAMANRDAAIEKAKVAQSQQASAQAEVNLAQVNFERAKFLLESGAIGQFDYDRAATDVETKQNRLNEAKNSVQAAEAAIRQAEADIQQAQAKVAMAAVSLGFKQIVSPLSGSGVVGDLPVKQGDYATTGEAIATITRNDFLELRISVPAKRSGQLQQGMTVELLDPGSQESLSKGKISFISPTVDTNLQTILIKARFPNSEGNLRDGQRVEAKIVWNNEPGILIPTTAISRVGSKSFVFVEEQQESTDGKTQQIVRQRPIQLGNIQGANYQVLEGLEVGDSIAVSNILKLRDGAAIQPQ